jgi:hypothetical protein
MPRYGSTLSVTEMKEGTFLLKFENEFVFSHDSLSLENPSLDFIFKPWFNPPQVTSNF